MGSAVKLKHGRTILPDEDPQKLAESIDAARRRGGLVKITGRSDSDTTCRRQGRRLHDYLSDAITADLHGQPIPALLAPP